MKIALFGGTGRVGKEIVRLALQDGHEVRMLVRQIPKGETFQHSNCEWIQGDVRKEEDVFKTVEGADAIVSALGTDRTTTLTEAVPHFIKAMDHYGIQRIVTIGTAGILQSRIDPTQLRYEAGDTNRKLTFAAEEHHAFYDRLRKDGKEWTIVCPTYLPDGEARGTYRVLRNYLPLDAKMITVGDTAAFAYEELTNRMYLQSRVGMAY